MEITFEDFKKKVCSYNKKNWPMVESAYKYAESHHKGQKRASGEDYIIHPLNVAYCLANVKADSDTLCAALLHDAIEDTESTYEDIKKKFNPIIADLVDGVTKITSLEVGKDKESANLRKVITSIKKDTRIVIIKLFDRLHNMRTLQYKSKKRQQEIALETIEIYVPMAYYIGFFDVKDELENLSFKYLKPDVYKELELKLNTIHNDNKKILNNMINKIKLELNNEGIKCRLEPRFKDVYSVHKKMITHNTIDNIHDLIGINVIVKNIKDCYLALMIIHRNYPPLNQKFKDFIVKPKTNMYRSIHTTVFTDNNRLIQVQIKTKEMDMIAHLGITSYWHANNRKAFNTMQQELEEHYQFFKSIKELDSSIKDNQEFINLIKRELFQTNIYVRTTAGEIIELPEYSTPIDFAYKIHSDIGDNMVACIVNDVNVPIDYVLKSDDRVRIITDNKAYVDKSTWLDKCVTTKAKKKINEFIREKELKEKEKNNK